MENNNNDASALVIYCSARYANYVCAGNCWENDTLNFETLTQMYIPDNQRL